MATKAYYKLVRDGIPDIISRSGKAARVRGANKEEQKVLLIHKLHEEVEELARTTSFSKRLDEYADILEVLLAHAALHGVHMRHIEERRRKRRSKRGGFHGGIVLLSVRD